MLREVLPRARESLITRLLRIASDVVAPDGAADDDALEECQGASDGVLVEEGPGCDLGARAKPKPMPKARPRRQGDLERLGKSLLRPKPKARPPKRKANAGQAGGQSSTQWSSAAKLEDSEHPPHGAVGSWKNAAGKVPEDLGDQERAPMSRTQHRRRQRRAQRRSQAQSPS